MEKKPCSKNYPYEVLVELLIVTNKDVVPPDFVVLDKTLDTRMANIYFLRYFCLKIITPVQVKNASKESIYAPSSRHGDRI